jgi:diguanylate cyclase (GGDEF)-like protein
LLAEQTQSQAPRFFYIDLDGFKAINDLLGHAAGDQLLVEVSELMRQVAPARAVVARMGGDEFIILGDEMDASTARQTGQRLIDTLSSTSFLLNETAVTVGASVGIAIKSAAQSDFSTLLLEADKALYDAKLKGRSCAVLAPVTLPSLYFASDQGLDVHYSRSAAR